MAGHKRAGRPTSLEHPLDIPTSNGGTRRVTAGERIIELMATGSHVDTAAASIGVLRDSLHDWLRIGARTRIAITRGQLGHPNDPDAEKPPPDTHALRCMEFSIAVDAAGEQWLTEQEKKLEDATNTRTRTTITIKTDKDGNELERTERTETDGPDLATLRWRLERHPASRHRYRPAPAQLEHSGPEGEAIPVEHRLDQILDRITTLRTTEGNPDDHDADH